MRTETFHEEHDVELTEEERNIRGRQAARLALGLTKHDERVETEAEKWRTLKKTMAGEREQLVETLHSAARAAETGVEPRQVECREEVRGVMVETIRNDTGETVSSRPLTPDELRGVERERAAKAKPEPKKTTALTEEQRVAKLDAAIGALDGKPHVRRWIVGQLAKACTETTPAEIERVITAAIDDGRLAEDGDKLRRAAKPPTEAPVVPDDYQPEGAAPVH